MHDRGAGSILRRVQSLLDAGTLIGLSDRDLLDRFLERRDEPAELAFAVLVERHGRMVLDVCRRVLRDPHDAEDAFQATFLVLARRPGSLRFGDSLGPWLLGVATRVATRARSDERRRRARERTGLDPAVANGTAPSGSPLDRMAIQDVIDREIAGLPAWSRGPVLLCDLEGLTYEEAARRLGWPVGTVKSRLARARDRLRRRLARHGLTPAELAIVPPALTAGPPAGLVEATTRAASILISGRLTSTGAVPASVAGLTQGVLRTMTFSKLKLAAGGLLLAATGSATLFGQGPTQRTGDRNPAPAASTPSGKVQAPALSDDQVDVELLDRAWAAAIPRRDATVINRILADDFEGIDPVGNVFTKSSYIHDLDRGAFASGRIELDLVKTRLFGEAAVVTSRVRVDS